MAKNIMIQGTMSNVGKSLIVAGLCRVFRQDGYRVAPFKSQNMALNSFITEDGLEMGRAQVVQAEAAMLKPDARMNPILLKPVTDKGSQVIVNGKVIGNMKAVEYFKRKKEFIPNILDAYNSLALENDIIVIEGAGSPVELNLKKDDIVNMGFAKMVDAPVLIVGDIDRGGVFAQLYGTVELLDEDEKKRVKGVIINKFRGDLNILKPGLDILENLLKMNIAGVIPYTYADIDDEDSLSERINRKNQASLLDICVIKLPKISNFTDFLPFERFDGVSVRYVDRASDLNNPDMIVIPGTKSTIADLKWLRESGIETLIKKKAANGTPIFGICGGYQMLGKKIYDHNHVESDNINEIVGMELLDIETTFDNEKIQHQTSGKIGEVDGIFRELSNLDFNGYEIHMGRNDSKLPFVVNNKNVYGSYVHGLFDNIKICDVIIKALSKLKGINLDNALSIDIEQYKNKQYDLLADAIRAGMDMEYIYKLLD